MAKYIEIAGLVERRIGHGDYNLKPFPAERELAAEVGVAQRTARQALKLLEEKGLLVRRPNGCLELSQNNSKDKKLLRIAFLCPAFPSDDYARWQLAAQRTVEAYVSLLRPVYYVHWDDPIITDTLEGFDGVFLAPTSEPIPEGMIERLRDTGCPLAVALGDWTEYGVPSVSLCPPQWMHHVLDHLECLGHKRIDLLNCQPNDDTIVGRIEQWNLWRIMHGCKGELINEPVNPYQWVPQKAYEVMTRILDRGEFDSTALVTTTSEAAISVISALTDHGYQVGKDVSVATMNDTGLCQLQRPSITSLEMPDAKPYLSVCLEWMARGGKNWVGPLLVKPHDIILFQGQSTGPCPS